MWEFFFDDMIYVKPDRGNFFVEIFDEVLAFVGLIWLVFFLILIVPDISQKLVMVDTWVKAFRLELIFVLRHELDTIELFFQETVFLVNFIELGHEFLLQEFDLIELTVVLVLIIFRLK